MAWSPNSRHADYERFITAQNWKADKSYSDRYTIVTGEQMKSDSKYGSIDSEKAIVQRNNLVNFYKGNRKLFVALDAPTIPLSEFVKSCDNAVKCPTSYNSKFGGFSRITHVGRSTDPMTFYVVIVRHLDKATGGSERDAGYTRNTDSTVSTSDIPSHLRFQVIPVKFKPVYEKEGIG